MWSERAADRRTEIPVDGHRVVAYEYGSGDDVLLLLNGGPGLPCDYLRDAHTFLADHGLRVVAFDQLGCGASDRPDDSTLWSMERYVREVETVRITLGLGRVTLLGHSWGGWLAIEYVLTHPDAVRSLILADTAGDLPHLMRELHRLREELAPGTDAAMRAFEAEGRFDDPAYLALVHALDHRHVFRGEVAPPPLARSVDGWNTTPYRAMQGPNEFLYIGNLRNWSRLADMGAIRVPTLVYCGRFDEQTPDCAMRMVERLPFVEFHLFEQSSHMPFYEEPETYDALLLDFLARRRRG
jgi:proline iminopeptidase